MSLEFIVVGGELVDINAPNPVFRKAPDVIGIYQTREKAYDSWKAESWAKVDNAHARFLICTPEEYAELVARRLPSNNNI